MRFILPLLAFGLTTSLAAQITEVGEGNWKVIPYFKGTHTFSVSKDNSDIIDRIVESGNCKVLGNRNRIHMNVPFIAEIAKDRDVQRIVVKRIGCPEVEQVVAGVALNAARNGWLRSGNPRETAWFRGEVEYNLQ